MKTGCTSLCKHVLWVSKYTEYVLFSFQNIALLKEIIKREMKSWE